MADTGPVGAFLSVEILVAHPVRMSDVRQITRTAASCAFIIKDFCRFCNSKSETWRYKNSKDANRKKSIFGQENRLARFSCSAHLWSWVRNKSFRKSREFWPNRQERQPERSDWLQLTLLSAVFLRKKADPFGSALKSIF